jgi:radical SAM superfamily enzyme YgiQ (UPF0313 family)
MSLEVLLIAPTALDYHGQPIRKKKLYLPGLTMLSLAAVTPPEVRLTLVNEAVQDIPFDKNWDLVALTGMGSGLKRAWQIADVFRARGIPVVIGGIAASLAPAEWTLEHADHLITGEAEETWPQFLKDFQAGRASTQYAMPRRPDIRDIPLPRYDLMTPREKGLWRPVQATRGCPFPCDFCSIQAYFDRGYRKRPVDQIIRDVRAAVGTGSRYITFIDDNIGVDWKFFSELMTALIPERIFWASQCSIHIAERPDMLELAYRSGCRILSFGIESVNPGSVAAASKTFNHPENYGRLLDEVRKAGIAVSSEMIVGMEDDTVEVFDATYDFLMEQRVPLPRVYIMTPVPGTGMYREFEREGRIFDFDLANYNGGKAVFHPRKMTVQQLNNGYWRLYDRLYGLKSILARMRGVPSQTEWSLKAFILGTNFHYRGHVRQRITPGIV